MVKRPTSKATAQVKWADTAEHCVHACLTHAHCSYSSQGTLSGFATGALPQVGQARLISSCVWISHLLTW